MRKIQNIAFVLLATLFAGCINDNIENTLCRDGVLSINLSTRSAGTRADGVNDDSGSTDYPEESTIYDVQFFLYPSGSAGNVDATYAGVINVTPNVKPDHDTTTQEGISIPADVINTLCPNEGDKCDIYVIVNYLDQVGTDLTKDLTQTSRDELKALPLNTTFWDLGLPPTSFVMDSEVFEVTRGTGDNKNVLTSETIYVTRAAAKILLEVNVQTTVDVSGVTWQPVTEVKDANQYFMTLAFYNGVKEGVIDDDSDTDPAGKDIQATTEAPYYHIENVELIPGGLSNDIVSPGTSATRAESKAFTPSDMIYSYTTAWGDDDEDDPYFKLSIPWRKVVEGQDDNAAWVTYDYTVPIALNSNQLVRNKLYVIRLTVGALGDLNYLDPSVYSYVVLDWDEVSMNAELARPSYLMVDTNKVEMNNIPSYSVGYKSSDPVTAYITGFKCSFYYPVANGDSFEATKREINETYDVSEKVTNLSDVAPNLANYNISLNLDTKNNQVTLSHNLDNVIEDKIYHYFPYEVTVRVTNTVTGMYEDITFVQYPALYVEYETMNTNTVFINANDDNLSGWWYVRGTASNSKNIYKISVSAFDASTADYIIADPREPANNDNFVFRETISATSAVHATGADASGDDNLTGYRATISGPDSEHLVAPAFLVSSSWISNGGNGIQDYNYNTNGKYRCAGYQENGYPAGRWRLPTPAEIQVVARMCTEKKLENVFYAGGADYLSSNGAYEVLEDNGGTVYYTGTNSSTLRCVYDIWYWKDKCANTNQFIWGAEGDDLEAKRAAGYLTVIK